MKDSKTLAKDNKQTTKHKANKKSDVVNPYIALRGWLNFAKARKP